MVIVEELIARLGFEVGSLEDIRKASAELDELGKKVDGLAKTARIEVKSTVPDRGKVGQTPPEGKESGGGLQGKLKGIAEGIKALAEAVQGKAEAGGGLGGLLRAVAGGVEAMATGLNGNFVTALATAGKALVDFLRDTGAAAQAAVKQGHDARGERTTDDNVDSLVKTIQRAGDLDAEVAQQSTGKFITAASSVVRAAAGGDPAAQKSLNDLGINYRNTDGKPRDSTEAAWDVIERRRNFVEQLENAKNDPAAQENITKHINAIDKQFNIDKTLRGVFEKVNNGGMMRARREGNENNPNASAEDKARREDVANQATEFEQKLAALGGAFTNISNTIAQILYPAANTVAGRLVDLGKMLGLIPRSKEEIENEQLTKNENARAHGWDKHTLKDVDIEGDKLSDLEEKEKDPDKQRELHKQVLDKRKEAAQRLPPGFTGDAARRKAQEDIDKYAAAEEIRRKQSSPRAGANGVSAPAQPQSSQSAPAKSPAAPALDDWLRQMIHALPQITASISGDYNVKKAIQDKQTQSERKTDNRQYSEIGNDKRTINNSVTVNATGLSEVAAAAQRGVVTASAMVKGSNASTAALTAA